MKKGFFSSSELSVANTVSTMSRCGLCGLCRKCHTPKMKPTGEGKKGVLIVAEAPGEREDLKGIQLIGSAGQELRSILRSIDVKLDRDCWKTNAVICHPPENSTPTNLQIDACRPNLLKTIKRLKPHTIILLGKVAVDSLIPVVWKDKSGDSLSKWAGWNIPCRKENVWICPTYHPSYLLRANSDVLRLLTRQHLKQGFKHTSRPYESVPDYKDQIEIVYRPSEAAKIIREMIRKKKPTAYDIETNTLKPENEGAEIVCASLCQNGDRTIAYPWSGEAVEATLELLKNSDVPKIAGNMKFEDRWARHHYRTPVKNWMWDTVLCAHVLNNTRGVTSVKFQAFVRLGIESYDDHIKPFLSETKGGRLNRIKDLDIRDLMYYCAMDSAVEFDIYLDQKAEMKRLVRSMEKNESI